MTTLSFECPKCGKLHDRIKPEMAGFKVQCQCGFVFRLGPKSSQDKSAFDEAVKSKRLAEEKKRRVDEKSRKRRPQP